MSICLPEMLWRSAVERWRAGDPSAAAKLLREGSPPPPWVREWLAEVVAGQAKRPRGRPKGLHDEPRTVAEAFRPFQVREAFRLFYAARQAAPRDGDKPSTLALEDTARKFAMSVDAVDKIVYPRRRKAGGS